MKKIIMILIFAMCIPTILMADGVKPVQKTNLFDWLNKNLVYPTDAAKKHEEGVVYVSFTIDQQGYAEHIEIESGISESLNNEALKAVENMPLAHLYSANEPNKSFILPIKFSIK